VQLPLAVGFGISTPAQVAALAGVADGVVIGSELVRLVEARAGEPDLARALGRHAAALAAPLLGGR
jgi:tryptophan synthase alpha chain